MFRLAVPALLLVAGCAPMAAPSQRGQDRDMARVERTLRGLTPGAPQRCIHRGDVTELRTARGVILYVGGRDLVYRNDIVGSCPGLSRGDTVVSYELSRDYCAGDIVQTRAPIGGTLSGSCSLGQFIPYTR